MSPRAPRRLPTGGLIDRARTLRFQWEGREYVGHPGDTLASALMANGVTLLGRSFKYHRPRGLLAAGVEEPNVLVQLGTGGRSTPNVRATEIELYDGLDARPVNCWPSAAFDLGAVNGLLSPFLGAGFYYKTFMWPHWHLFEGPIRRAAGIGRAADAPDPDRYETAFARYDTVVVGAGPSGVAAALAAASKGGRVALVEQDHLVGGSLLYEDEVIEGQTGAEWLANAREYLAAAGVDVRLRTTVTGYFDHGALAMLERITSDITERQAESALRHRLWQVRTNQIVLATGAIERPLVFPSNDRPGVMLASAMRHYVRRHAALPGTCAALFANNDAAWRTADVLIEAGVRIAAIIDERAKVSEELIARFASLAVPVHLGARIVATRGYRRVTSARIRLSNGRVITVACDCIAMSGGYNPTLHLFGQAGGQLRYDADTGSFVPDGAPGHVSCVGAAAGHGDPSSGASLQLPHGRGKAFVDFQNDVTSADIALAAREGYRSVEHLKRYTTLGMAPDQGKTANVNALRIMAALSDRTPAETGTTRFRFPYTPVPLASFAGADRGELFRPLRRLPAHARHVAAGALFEEMGGFLRPAGYPLRGEDRAFTEQREANSVRCGAGLFDASPLGKIEVVGPDAAIFLDRIYANRIANLAVGRVRYGLMLDERGTVIDDGVVARLAPDRFLISTTSAGASRIADWLEEWLQCEWTELDVVVAPITTAWAVLTLTGPTARDVLCAALSSIDLDPATFPHMSWREGTVAGLPARVQRVSYTGELSYEIAVAPSRAGELWDVLMASGTDKGIVPVGVDAWMILRTEKGYLHVGSDTDGTTIPLDIGWGHVLKKTSDFVGRRSLLLPEQQRTDRHQFVGLSATDGSVLPVGAHVLGRDRASDGYVTSSAFSPAVGRGVALGMLRAGQSRIGEAVDIRTFSGVRQARVVELCSFDPKGERLHV